MADIQLKHFFIRAIGDQESEERLNRFLRGHQVLEVRQEFVADATNSVWCIAVRYAQGGDGTYRQSDSRRSSIDYMEVLEPEVFARYAELRDRRKAIAEEDSVKAFAVFSNRELAAIAEFENPQLKDLRTVKGIGSKKAERFGLRILNLTEEPDDETRGPAV